MNEHHMIKAAEWIVHTVGIPFDTSAVLPPPPALRDAIYGVVYRDEGGTLHNNELSYDEVVRWVDEEAGWDLFMSSIEDHERRVSD